MSRLVAGNHVTWPSLVLKMGTAALTAFLTGGEVISGGDFKSNGSTRNRAGQTSIIWPSPGQASRGGVTRRALRWSRAARCIDLIHDGLTQRSSGWPTGWPVSDMRPPACLAERVERRNGRCNRTILAKTRDAEIEDDAFFDGLQLLVSETHRGHRAGAEILQHDVGLAHEIGEDLLRSRRCACRDKCFSLPRL